MPTHVNLHVYKVKKMQSPSQAIRPIEQCWSPFP